MPGELCILNLTSISKTLNYHNCINHTWTANTDMGGAFVLSVNKLRYTKLTLSWIGSF